MGNRNRPTYATAGSSGGAYGLTVLKLFAAIALFATSAVSVLAQPYPSKPIRLIVGQAPGGSVDVVSRLMGQQLSTRMGQPVIVENRLGAGGNIAAESVAKSPPDGYTLLMGAANMAINATLYKNLTYSPATDFTPIALISTVPTMMLVSPSLPVKDFAEFLVLAKSKADGLNYASGGIGTSEHLAGEMFKAATGISAVHIPYKGCAPAMADVMGGQPAFMFTNQQCALPLVKSGKLRAFGIATAQRSSALPDVPTFAELGIPNFFIATWNGIMGPAGMPRDIVNRLNREVNAALVSPEFKERLTALSAQALSGTPEAFASFYANEVRNWGEAVRKSGATSD